MDEPRIPVAIDVEDDCPANDASEVLTAQDVKKVMERVRRGYGR